MNKRWSALAAGLAIAAGRWFESNRAYQNSQA
jgi:hypothetical protein